MNKEETIKQIANRIKEEYEKHSHSIDDWHEIAARKIVATCFENDIVSNEEITKKAYKSLDKKEHLTEFHKQGYFTGYKNGCYWIRSKYNLKNDNRRN